VLCGFEAANAIAQLTLIGIIPDTGKGTNGTQVTRDAYPARQHLRQGWIDKS
jgi:hypothetical protein